MKEDVIFMLGMVLGVVVLGTIQKALTIETKAISYPEEIQAIRAGDTLIVSSVSDSIYIGFNHLKH